MTTTRDMGELRKEEKWAYKWCGRKYLPERYGQKCRIITARYGKFLVKFEDGSFVTTVRGTVRRR